MKSAMVMCGLVVLMMPTALGSASACGPRMQRPPPAPAGWGRPLLESAQVPRAGWGNPISVTGVSGPNNDCRPSLTADGRTICFQTEGEYGAAYHPDHIPGVTNIYTAKWNGASWDSLAPVDSAACAYGKFPFISSDGTRIFFDRLGGNGDIFFTERAGDHWAPAQSVGDSVNTQQYFEGFPCLSFDGQDLYFASSRPGSLGVRDLWVSHRVGNLWSAPENLGPGVNMPNATNWNPFITADGTRLFFSREQYARFTVHELWVSTWDGTHWGNAVNVGAPVNSCMQTCSCFLVPGTDRLYLGGEVCEGGFGGVQDIFCTGVGPPGVGGGGPAFSNPWQPTAEMDSTWHVHCLFEAADGSIYAGTGPFGKVYRTTDAGDSWVPTAPLPSAMKVYDLAQTSDGVIFAATYPNGDVFKSTGTSWTNCAALPGVTTARGLWTEADTLYVATFPSTDADLGFVYKTGDGGSSWERLTPLPRIVGGIITGLFTSGGTLLCGAYSDSSVIYRSTDRGASWSTSRLPISEGSGEPWAQVCFIEEIAPDTVYAGGWVHGDRRGAFVWRSGDDGATWDSTGSRIVVNGVHATKAYGCARQGPRSILVGFQPGPDSVVCASRDGGDTWRAMGSLGGAREALCLLRSSHGAIYAGTTPQGDVYRWMPPSEVGEGIQTERGFALVSTLPNPTGGHAGIVCRVVRPGRVTLRIFNASGRRVRTLVDETRAGGVYLVDWDGTDSSGRKVPRGTYVAELRTAGGLTGATRIVLLK